METRNIIQGRWRTWRCNPHTISAGCRDSFLKGFFHLGASGLSPAMTVMTVGNLKHARRRPIEPDASEPSSEEVSFRGCQFASERCTPSSTRNTNSNLIDKLTHPPLSASYCPTISIPRNTNHKHSDPSSSSTTAAAAAAAITTTSRTAVIPAHHQDRRNTSPPPDHNHQSNSSSIVISRLRPPPALAHPPARHPPRYSHGSQPHCLILEPPDAGWKHYGSGRVRLSFPSLGSLPLCLVLPCCPGLVFRCLRSPHPIQPSVIRSTTTLPIHSIHPSSTRKSTPPSATNMNSREGQLTSIPDDGGGEGNGPSGPVIWIRLGDLQLRLT